MKSSDNIRCSIQSCLPPRKIAFAQIADLKHRLLWCSLCFFNEYERKGARRGCDYSLRRWLRLRHTLPNLSSAPIFGLACSFPSTKSCAILQPVKRVDWLFGTQRALVFKDWWLPVIVVSLTRDARRIDSSQESTTDLFRSSCLNVMQLIFKSEILVELLEEECS